jgi:hypothetical protein
VVVVVTAGVRNGEVVKVMAEVEAATGALNGEVGVAEITGVATGEEVGPKHHKSTKISHELRKNKSVYGKNFFIPDSHGCYRLRLLPIYSDYL